MTGFRPVGEKVVYTGWAITVTKGTFVGPDGDEFQRDVIRHPGAVAVLPIIDGEVVLTRQYRAALDAHVLEIPAGIRDVSGEPEAETAQRELAEEVGLRAGTLELLARVHNCVGYCDEEIVIFRGTDLSPVERAVTDSPEEQQMEIVRVPLPEVEAMVFDGRITDAKTTIGVLAHLRRS